jgi:hypothetical protein
MEIGPFDIPKPDSKSPIIIFIDPEIDADLRSSPDLKGTH